MVHKKWQYHLLNMMKKESPIQKMKQMVNDMYQLYPKGFVANVDKGEAPEKARGLARYLAKYMASPPISVRRIINYDEKTVTYWYNDHETKARKVETIDVLTFIGRKVQHILPKGFQRIRYYGLQATRTYTKWSQGIKKGIKNFTIALNGVYEVVASRNYRQRYMESYGTDPMKCPYCGHKMTLWIIWNPKYGVVYDEEKNIRQGKYERFRSEAEVESGVGGTGGDGRRNEGGKTIRGSHGVLQISLFPV